MAKSLAGLSNANEVADAEVVANLGQHLQRLVEQLRPTPAPIVLHCRDGHDPSQEI
jgi:hypothetical protein